MVKITGIEKGSRAEKVGIRSGDSLISINGNEICDVLDYRFYLAERQVELLLLGEGGEYSAVIKKGEYDDIGLLFETPLMDEKHSCKEGHQYTRNEKGICQNLEIHGRAVGEKALGPDHKKGDKCFNTKANSIFD